MIRCANLQRNEGKKTSIYWLLQRGRRPKSDRVKSYYGPGSSSENIAATEAEMIAAVFPLTAGSPGST